MKIWRVFEMCFALSGVLFADESLYAQHSNDLWQVYQQALRKAKYVDLTHTITPIIPVWKGIWSFQVRSNGESREWATIRLR